MAGISNIVSETAGTRKVPAGYGRMGEAAAKKAQK